MEKWLLVLGASSDIAKATAQQFAEKGFNIHLAHQKHEKLKNFAGDLEVRHNIKTQTHIFDALNIKSHDAFYKKIKQKPEAVLCAVGYLGDQKKAEKDQLEAQKTIDINFTGCASILQIIAQDFEKKKKGSILCITSVAGDRGRQSNYVYGSAKAGLSAFLSGLRVRMAKSKVSVTDIKPGFVNTSMTAGMDLPKPLIAEPEEVAADIFKAYKKKKNMIYTKWFWRYIMLIIKNIPEFVFKKLSL